MYKYIRKKTSKIELSTGDSEGRLFRAAREILVDKGLGGLRLREVAKRARVNLGLFHYHFGSKREFVRQLLQEIYEEFFSRLSIRSREDERPEERLKASLILFGKFARDNRRIAVSLLSEALCGDKSCGSYMEKNIPRHFGVISDLIARGQKSGVFKTIPNPVATAFALGSMGMPNLLITALERGRSFSAKRNLPGWKEMFLSDKAIEQRADLVMSALIK